ncbi:hypothetical protein LINGRAHAP2_LOCUS27786 [Linum grandiflorum]
MDFQGHHHLGSKGLIYAPGRVGWNYSSWPIIRLSGSSSRMVLRRSRSVMINGLMMTSKRLFYVWQDGTSKG